MASPLRYEVEAAIVPGGRAETDRLDDASPPQLLAAAFAGCLLESLERSATPLRFRYDRASVHVVVERHGTPPTISRVRYELLLDTDEPPGRVGLVHRNLLRFGSVTSTLALACEIEGRVVVSEPVPTAS